MTDSQKGNARVLRLEHGMSITEIARELGVPRSSVGFAVQGLMATRYCKLCGAPHERRPGVEFCCLRHKQKYYYCFV